MEYPCNNTYDIFFLEIPRIFLEQKKKMIYYEYFQNMNEFSSGKRHVL